MAKKSSKRRKASRMYSVSTFLPLIRIGLATADGMKSAREKSGQEQVAQLVNVAFYQTTGINPNILRDQSDHGGRPSFAPDPLVQNITLYVAGKVAKKVSGKLGVNRVLRKLGSPIGV